MRLSRTVLLPTALGLSALGILPAAASAQTTSPQNVTCRGTIGAVAVDNVEVPEGASCTLSGTQVLGSIHVEPRARLSATAVNVRGNVEGTGATSVIVARSTVAGSFQVTEGRAARINGSTVGGAVQADKQTGLVTFRSNRVAGDMQAFENSGGVVVETNRVRGNLQCKDNLPAPTGGGNIVTGLKEDQCALL
ncbi:MAG: hypothetical protein MUF83_14005 [Acidimicrobiales bacterium]|jgi:hypothetical protein|nr:hypothetical protein [Acidimicrobiales bacterium]